MLSSSVIKNTGQASHYYSQQDNYYTQEQGIEQSEWWGKGAAKLSLSGQVNTQQFTDLLLGKLATGEQLGKMVDGQIKHRPGWDLTLSAPKSVSILALIGGDQRLLDAHRQAVKVALKHIERSCAQARIQTPDGVGYQNTKNLIAALYHHDLSRAKDPQLHTHSVIMNMTERTDGKWRSLASKLGGYDEKAQGEINGFIERVRHDNRYFSKLYEAELAFRVKELGYEITTETESGIFEIAGVSKEAIKQFSKRRAQIENKLAEKGLSGGKAAAIATLDTRDAKEEVDRTQLKEQWEKEIKHVGMDCQPIIDKSCRKNETHSILEHAPEANVIKAIQQAAKSLSVFQSTFTLEEVVIHASEFAIRANMNVDALLKATEVLATSGDLVSLSNARGKTLFMTKATMDDEKRLFSQLEDKQLKHATIDSHELQFHLGRNDVPSEHHAHLETLFGRERVVLVEGESTREILVEPAIKMARAARQKIMLLSQSLVGSKQFAHALTPEPKSFFEKIKALFVNPTPDAMSVMQFLSAASDQPAKYAGHHVLMVENAHLLSTYHQAKLFEWNKNHDSKLILLGNQSTLLSQQLGVPLNKLIERGIATISIGPKPSSMEKDIAQGNLQSVVDKMASQMVEVAHEEDRHHAMATHFSKLGANTRSQTWLVANHKKTINELNVLTHQSLLTEGQLGKAIGVNVLAPVFLAEGKGVMAGSYQKNQLVRFNESYSSLQINRGEYLRVVRHSKISNRVVLQKDNGQHVVWQPDKIAGGSYGKVELFNEIKREFAVNETIFSNRSLQAKGIAKGERLFISAINNRHMSLKNISGKIVTLDLSKPYHRHIDYGYAATLHGIAHEKPDCLIADLPARSFSSDQRRFYQLASQPKEVWVYTDDNKKLVNQLEKSSGERATVQDVLAQSQALKKNCHEFYQILEAQLVDHKKPDGPPVLSHHVIEAVEYAMHHLAEREAGFTHKNLMEVAMKQALGNVTAESLAKATMAMEKAGVMVSSHRGDGTLWTTLEAVNMEREIIALCNQDKGKLEPIASDSLLEKHCATSKLKPEQIAAVRAITQSKDRVMAIQGHPGTGKTTMLATVADVLSAKNVFSDEGYQLLGLAPTHTAVKELTERGIPAKTLDSFLHEARREVAENKQAINHDKQVLVIDEASMVSNRKMVEVLRIVHQLGFRGAIPTGDTRQLAAIESGKPFELVQTQVNTQSLVDITRQSDEAPALKEAVKETIAYDFKTAFKTLKDSMIEVTIQSKDQKISKEERMATRIERVERLVNDYFSFAKGERENIQVITPGHDDRVMANNFIRDGLKKEGTLSHGADRSFSVLSAKSFTHVERSHISNFKAGDVLRFAKQESAQIKSGDYFTITAMNKNHSVLTLKGEAGRTVVWQIPTFDKERLSSVEVFQREARAVQAGDVIRWSRSDKQNGLLGTETARVVALDQNKLTVELANKQLFSFDPSHSKFQHWDHGYAATVYAVQGKTKDIILAHMESFRDNLINQPSFLVALTRAVNVFRLYTDSIEKLLKTIERNTGVKLSSLEVIGEYPRKAINKIQDKSSKTTLADMIKLNLQKEKMNTYDRYALENLKEGLNKDAEKIATHFLGSPKEKGGHYLKFGSKQGSLTVTIKGEKQGWFNDFETNQGGRDMLKFIQVHGGMRKDEALNFAADWLGMLTDRERKKLNTPTQVSVDHAHKSNEKLPHSFSDYEKKRIKLANQIARESVPLKGTLAETYLKNYRGIELDHVPEDIRFHPHVYSGKNQKALPALVAIARNSHGKIQSVEAIYLDEKTANKADVPLSKQTIGSKKGAMVIINQTNNVNAPTLIAEGVVTGLSLAKSLPDVNVRITLGKQMFTSIDPAMLSQKTIFCLDNDGKNLKSDKVIADAASRIAASKDVSFMMPTGLDLKKQDYNDILKQKGVEAIRNDFHHAISRQDFYKNKDNPSVDSARIDQFSKIIQKEMNHQDKAHLQVYKAMTEKIQSVPMEQSLSRIHNMDREI